MVICKNCQHQYSEADKFCGNCGQKKTAHTLTLSELVTNFWSSVFNLDNTLFKTLKYIWAPWKLTQFYVDGKRQSFFNPMRLFLVTLLFHFGYLVSLTNIDNKKTKSQDEYYSLERSKIFEKYQNEKDQFDDKKSIMPFCDTLEKKIFKNVKLPEKDTFMNGINFIGDQSNIYITRKDAIELPIDSIYKKYNITSFYKKLEVKQLIRINLDRAGTIKYALGNAAWGILFAIILLAGFFKLLYWRKNHYYVEHLVFWMNIHSLSFIVVTLSIYSATKFLQNDDPIEYLFLLMFLSLGVILYLSMYKYYRQGKIKTFAKFVMASLFYLMVGLAVISLVGVASLVFF